MPVSIAKNRGNKKGAEKLVNAVLRKLSSQPLPDPSKIKRVNKRYSVQYSLPVWLVKKLIEQYGEERALAIFQSLFVRNKASGPCDGCVPYGRNCGGHWS